MFKKLLHFAGVLAIACTLPACSIKEQRTNCPSQVNVLFSGFQIRTDASDSRSVRTKATPADSAGVGGIVFAVVDAEGDIVYSAQQNPKDAGFGAVSFELTEGEYTFVAEAHIIPGPFRQNCKTTITGEFYSTSAASSFQFDTEWGTPIDGGW